MMIMMIIIIRITHTHTHELMERHFFFGTCYENKLQAIETFSDSGKNHSIDPKLRDREKKLLIMMINISLNQAFFVSASCFCFSGHIKIIRHQ